MTVTPEHESLHRTFAEDKGVFASAVSRALHIETPVPVHLEPLNVDFTEFRPVVLDDDARERIQSCIDQETLGLWFDRTFEAATVEDLFKD
jgi:hypothetical protein